MWYVDFILVHKTLQTKRMYSIEREMFAKEAEFNRPYDCIHVVAGDTTKMLPDMESLSRKAIVWLDHDTGLEGPALTDAKIICEKAKSGSIFITTVNAEHKRLRPYKSGTNRFSRLKSLRQYAGDLVPPSTTRSNSEK